MGTTMKTIETKEAPEAVGPYSQAVRAGDWLYCSGQIGFLPETGELAGPDTQTQAARAIGNLKAVLEAAGGGLANVVKTTLYVVDMTEFPKVNEVYGRCFGDHLPARATVGVASLPKGARFEIEAIAYFG